MMYQFKHYQWYNFLSNPILFSRHLPYLREHLFGISFSFNNKIFYYNTIHTKFYVNCLYCTLQLKKRWYSVLRRRPPLWFFMEEINKRGTQFLLRFSENEKDTLSLLNSKDSLSITLLPYTWKPPIFIYFKENLLLCLVPMNSAIQSHSTP